MKCEVCEVSDSKYRCPCCRVLYCSVGCYKAHKDKCEELKLQNKISIPGKAEEHIASDDVEPGEVTDSEPEDEDKVGPEQLSLLENSKAIKDMLQNKHLRRIIKEINEKDDPEKELDSAMMLPIFVEFANECLKTVEEKPDDGTI